MKLAVISDTHMPRGPRAIPQACLERCAAADAILHAGDLSSLAVLELLEELGPPVYAVHGNVDDADVRRALPEARQERFERATIAMVHDPGARQGRVERLRRRFPEADAVVFGHTHMPEHQEGAGTFQIFNPGSPTERRRSPRHTMGEATVTGSRVWFQLVHLD